MKRKLMTSSIVVAVLAAYVIGARWLGIALGLQGRSFWILWGGLAVLGVLVAVVALTYLLRKPAPPPPPKDAVVEDLQKSLVAAEKKLAVAKVAPAGALGKLPVVLLLGPPGSTKTSSVVRSGVDVELLTGDVFRDDAVLATRGVNLWFGRNTLFVEPGRDIADDPTRWRWFMRRLQPSRLKGALSSGQQAPRVAVVCYSCEALTAAGGGDAGAAAARALRDRLGQLAQEFGIKLPVYVVFSKADRVPGFAEYVQNFTPDETRVVVGATLPLASRTDGASHAERESRRLSDAWTRIFSGLASRRIEVLARESVGDRKPAAYEFPREVRKLAPAAVQFLVELCRPTELGVGPVLRGFYLTGVRAVVSGEGAAAMPSLSPAREAQPAGATSVFRPVAAAMSMAPPTASSGGRKKPEWVFLSGLFQEVILADAFAMGVTRGGVRISALRRTLAAVGVGLAATLAIAFTVSFVNNRRLQSSVERAAAAAATLPQTTVAAPTAEQLVRLDSLRQQVEVLSRYNREGAWFWLGMGLYSGDRMYGPARALYFNKFERLLYDSTRVAVRRAVSNLAVPDVNVPYDSAYRLLRGYLVTTDQFQHSTSDFLGPVLANAWPNGAAADSATRRLARAQFDFFGAELAWGNPYPDRPDDGAVAAARALLKRAAGINPIYQSMLTEAARHGQPVRLGAVPKGALVNRVEVPAEFTRGAWGFFVDTALGPRLKDFLQGDTWVTGGSVQLPASQQQLAVQLRARYADDYASAWRNFVHGASVPPFAGLQDAAQKLDVLSGPTSPLLGMLLTVSQHIAVDPNGVKPKLQPVDVVMPLANAKTFVGGNNQQYMESLGGLYNAVQAAVTTGATGGTAPLEQAATAVGPARDAVRKLAVKFSQEPEALLRLQDLLLSPVVGTEQLVKVALGGKKREGEAADINAQALAFCEDVRPILDKYPFVLSARVKATNSDLARVFRPNGGRVSQFYEQFLRGKVLTSNGGQFRSAGTGLVPAEQLTQFLTRAKRITDALFPGGSSEPRVLFTLRPQLSDPSPITVTFGDESFNAVKGSEQPFTASWRFGDSSYVGFARRGSNAAQDIGPWAPFKIYWEEARRAGPNGGRMYDIVLSGAIRGSVELTIAAGGLSDPAFFSGLNCPTKAVQ